MIKKVYKLSLFLFFAGFAFSAEPRLAVKPPMGWNSFDSYGVYLSEKEAFRNIDAMVELLKPSGYEYFVVDNGWFGEYKLKPGTRLPSEKHASDVKINKYGILQPSDTYFPGGFKTLSDYVHSKGLKFGLHLMRGIPRKAVEKNTPIKGTSYFAADIADKKNTCSWCLYNYGVDMDKAGAQEFYDSLVAQLAEWGVDFIKADDIVPYPKEVEALAKAIKKSGRPMVLSLSPGDHVRKEDLPVLQQGNMLRVTSDIWDDEKGIIQCFEAWKKWEEVSVEGFWIDMDMIPFGKLQLMSPPPSEEKESSDKHVALSGKGYTRQSALTQDQMYTFITMRALSASPLMVGGSLIGLDPFSLELLTNKEIVECNQNGVMGRIISNEKGIIIAKTPRKTGNGGWIGVFNRKITPHKVKLSPELFGLKEETVLFDIWNRKEVLSDNNYEIPGRGVIFIKYK